MKTPSQLIRTWLTNRLDDDNDNWLEQRLTLISTANSDRDLHITLGMIPRKMGRDDLALSTEELAEAAACVDGWDPSQWSIDTAARVLVLCQLAVDKPDQFGATLKDLCRTADVAESIALYTSFSVLPHDPALDSQVGEGLRTNMRAVFEAIAHRNPFPRKQFDQNRWNHMVLKALFVESSLYPIQGLDERANAELATIMSHYAHERWAAGRPVTPELWRCVGPYATGEMLDDLKKVVSSDNPREQQAGVLALSQSPDPRAADLLKPYTDVQTMIATGTLSWDTLGESL
ncbi:MAG: EboA domain-containing protein [Granulosicoccus sp.]|nr:EboA domain-containing protein [Granulosicoccus sp.]